jgi:GT2 family glycosyltransferase
MLEDAVESLLEHSSVPGEPAEILVVDNGTSAARLLADIVAVSDRVSVLTSRSNLGYGGGMNLGIDEARQRGADVVVLLNDDVRVESGWLIPLLDELRSDASIGVVQPLLLSADGEEVNSAGVVLDDMGAGSDRLRGRPAGDAGVSSSELEVFTGGAIACRLDFFADVGGFDERFFLYYEDVELARRGKQSSAGWRYRIVPGSRIRHRGSATTAGLGTQLVYLRERNRLWSSALHGSRQEIVAGFWLSIRRLRRPPHGAHARALAAGVVGSIPRFLERRRSTVAVGTIRQPRPARGAARRLVGTPGVNVLGYHHISSGLGSIARQIALSLEAAGVPVVQVDNDISTSPRRRAARPIPPRLHDVTIAVVTAFEFAAIAERYPQLFGPDRRVVGVWFWELAQVPDEHRRAAAHADEIWAPSRFVLDTYRPVLEPEVPVRYAPFRVDEPDVDEDLVARWRHEWGDDVVFLVAFDFLSIFERKNPLGAISAFRTAFAGDDRRVRLIIKSINGEQRPDDLASVRAAAAGDPRIELHDVHLDDSEHHALLAAADCLVSLHRSEGYGLHPALAMWVGTVVVATRYSGVVDFLDDTCAAMIDHTMVPVSGGQGIYADTASWADPDLAQAAAKMRRLVDDSTWRDRLAATARARMAEQPSHAQFGEGLAALLRSGPSSNGPESTRDAFYQGLDASRTRWQRAHTWLRASRRRPAWPDTARR